jgi:ribosome maturation factor RimP
MTSMKATAQKISDLVADDLTAMGYDLVRVKLTPGGQYLTLQVMAERLDNKPMTVEDCVAISHAVSPKLDEADPLAARYTLEVSSPGIDRPLVRLKDFERFQGHLARIELDAPLAGIKHKRFQGSIVRVSGKAHDDAEIEFRTENGPVRVALSAIAKARLVLTDALMQAEQSRKH